jgi:hypothetical protein
LIDEFVNGNAKMVRKESTRSEWNFISLLLLVIFAYQKIGIERKLKWNKLFGGGCF